MRDRDVFGEVLNVSQDPYSLTFFTDLDKLLIRLNLTLQQFDLFAVGAGPGSFTGLRMGLTTAKAWAEIYGKPIAPVSCLAALAFKVTASRRPAGALVVAVSDARRGQIFGGVYKVAQASAPDQPMPGPAGPTIEPTDFMLEPITDEVVLSAGEFIELVTNLVRRVPVPVSPGTVELNPAVPAVLPTFVSSSPGIIRPALECSSLSGAPVEEVSGALAAPIGELGYLRAIRGDVVDALALEANYLRRPDAERNWKRP